MGCSGVAPPPEQTLAEVADEPAPPPSVAAAPPSEAPPPIPVVEHVPVPPPAIVDWPIPFDEERKQLSIAYLKEHRGEEYLTGDLETDIVITPRVVVLHWTAG